MVIERYQWWSRIATGHAMQIINDLHYSNLLEMYIVFRSLLWFK
jgi:hypothetical protein